MIKHVGKDFKRLIPNPSKREIGNVSIGIFMVFYLFMIPFLLMYLVLNRNLASGDLVLGISFWLMLNIIMLGIFSYFKRIYEEESKLP